MPLVRHHRPQGGLNSDTIRSLRIPSGELDEVVVEGHTACRLAEVDDITGGTGGVEGGVLLAAAEVVPTLRRQGGQPRLVDGDAADHLGIGDAEAL